MEHLRKQEPTSRAIKPMFTQEEILAVIKEINTFRAEAKTCTLEIDHISHLFLLEAETFLVRYTTGASDVFCRDDKGSLAPAHTWSYWASEQFADTHGCKQEEPGQCVQATAEE